MGKINRCLKCLFIFFNVLFAILGCLLIFGAIMSSVYTDQLSAVVWIWLFAIGILGISCLGIYAGFSEKEIILKIFAGFMVVGIIIMLIFGIIVAVKRNKIKLSVDSVAAKAAKPFMEDEKLRTMLDGLQQDAHCCGVVSASDWGDNIPRSCKCSGYGGYGGSECKSKPQGVSGPDRIYAQPCSKVNIRQINSFLKSTMGMCFGLSFIPLLELLVSLLMIRQIQNHDSW